MDCDLFFMCYRGRKSVLRKKPAGQFSHPQLTKSSASIESSTLSTNTTSNPILLQRNAFRYPNRTSYAKTAAVVGTPFYIMEFLDGRIFTDVYMPQLDPKDRREWCVPLLSDSPLKC
jgi:hypothetical protein